MSKDRNKLREERAEAVKTRKKICSGNTYKNELFRQAGGGTGTASTGQRRYVVDEEAFFNAQEEKTGEEMGDKGQKSLGNRLGLEEETEEPKKDPTKKKTAEELEKEKEIEEVRKIIGDGKELQGLGKYMKEVDLLEIGFDPAIMADNNTGEIDLFTFDTPSSNTSKGGNIDLLGKSK